MYLKMMIMWMCYEWNITTHGEALSLDSLVVYVNKAKKLLKTLHFIIISIPFYSPLGNKPTMAIFRSI